MQQTTHFLDMLINLINFINIYFNSQAANCGDEGRVEP